ncbi:LysR family transcriptional regulator [Acidithiobacillus sulfuriphilus]|uniref:LysR family transcriptional regulator n=2 Tax=Acidithiobacillus sulfuriphilus TaxID=1867749 RepID=A0A3M8R9U8_9PROT|nr:LysR family transcriptional regulator [Acidithiobacillus sulfuriphilus]
MSLRLDAEQLLAFLAAAEAGSVSEAAATLHRGQPAISERLRKLTAAVGEPLYVREGSGIRLTAAGLALLPDIRRLRSTLQDIESLVARRRSARDGDLRIASTSLIANYLLPPYLQQFQKIYPGINLYIKSGVTYWNGINPAELDLFFFEGEMDLPNLPDYYEVSTWRTDEIIAIMPRNHPLAKAEFVEMEDILPYPIVWREPSSGVRRILEKEFLNHHIRPAHFIEVADVESVGAMVKADLGVGFVTMTAFQRRQDWDLSCVRLSSPNLRWQGYMAAPKKPRRSRALSVFLIMLRSGEM